MSKKIVVAVSPFYYGDGWTDPYTLIDFKPNDHYAPIEVDTSADLRGIQRSLLLNTLVLLDGEIEQAETVETDKLDPSELTNEKLQNIVNGESNSKELEELKSKVATITSEKDVIATELSSLKVELTSTKKELTTTKSNLTKTTNQLNEKLAEIEELKKQIPASE